MNYGNSPYLSSGHGGVLRLSDLTWRSWVQTLYSKQSLYALVRLGTSDPRPNAIWWEPCGVISLIFTSLHLIQLLVINVGMIHMDHVFGFRNDKDLLFGNSHPLFTLEITWK